MKNYFKLFSNCKIVKGAKVSILCDLQRGNFIYLSDGLLDILENHLNKNIDEIIQIYNIANKKTIIEYFDYLIKNDFLFIDSFKTKNNFPEIQTKFDLPEQINNAIIDSDKKSNHNWKKIFDQLSLLLCKHLEIRYFDVISLKQISEIIKNCHNKNFHSLNIFIKYYKEINLKELFDLVQNNYLINHVFVHSTPIEKIENYKNLFSFIEQEINDENCCGNISIDKFTINQSFYNESKSFNTCLNKKISIDKNGNIKNCPSMKESFGNISKNNLTTTIKNKKFLDLWKIKKDDLNICKVCQFRYMCTDCRAFVKDKYSKPLKCNYDPINNIWH